MPATRTYASRPKTAQRSDASQARKKPAQAKAGGAVKPKPAVLTQLHLAFDNCPLKACKTCGLTYTRGVPEDEALHKTHCARVQRGLDWNRDEEKTGVQLVDAAASPSPGIHGRIISLRADAGGKAGAKLATVFDLMNTVLAAPPLSQTALKATKVYLFLVKPKNASREHIAGCVLAQRISTSLAVLPTSDTNNADPKLVHGLYCAPEPLPTPLGIPRVFVPTTYRRKGIARALIDAAARTAIHGCPLDPREGQLAFSQPTDSGRRLMDSCGVQRVYEEDDDDQQ